MRGKSSWISLELGETSNATAEKTFASYHPTNRKVPDNSFVQMNNFSSRYDRHPLSRTKKRNQIGSSCRRMKNHDDDHACE